MKSCLASLLLAWHYFSTIRSIFKKISHKQDKFLIVSIYNHGCRQIKCKPCMDSKEITKTFCFNKYMFQTVLKLFESKIAEFWCIVYWNMSTGKNSKNTTWPLYFMWKLFSAFWSCVCLVLIFWADSNDILHSLATNKMPIVKNG